MKRKEKTYTGELRVLCTKCHAVAIFNLDHELLSTKLKDDLGHDLGTIQEAIENYEGYPDLPEIV